MDSLSAVSGLDDLTRLTRGDPRVRVAILDGAIDLLHPSLASKTLVEEPSCRSLRGSNNPTFHGTHVASVILGKPINGILGLAHDVSGFVFPIVEENEAGIPGPCAQQTIATAIGLALARECNVINISGGAPSPVDRAHPALVQAIQDCTDRGVLVVVATGNQGCECAQLPAALPQALAVGAVDESGEPLPLSNWGAAYRSHGIVALGKHVPGARKGGGTAHGDGTSYAAAIVSGVSALLLSLQLKKHGVMNPPQVRAALLDTAIRSSQDNDRVLHGRLNVEGAMRAACSTIPPHKFQPSADALRRIYKDVSQEKFGTTDVTLPDGRMINVPDLHYRLADGTSGMNVVPVNDTDGHEAVGSEVIDTLLRSEMQIGTHAPIFALVTFTRPDEHSVDVPRLLRTNKLRLGHQHLAAYVGGGSTTHSLPSTRMNEWRRCGSNFGWNVKTRPANVHVLSLQGTPQETLNRNARMVDSIITSGSRSPVNTENTHCRTVDINTVLQYYRDWILGGEYLSDLDWYMNCANQKTVVVNIALNLPHNQRAFADIFDGDTNIWTTFTRRYEQIAGTTLKASDETAFTPLWALEGLTSAQIRPPSLLEYNDYRAAETEQRLDKYEGFRPLPPGQGLAWPLETVADVLEGMLDTYVSFERAGGVACALALLTVAPAFRDVLRLSNEQVQPLVDSIASKLLAAEVLVQTGSETGYLHEMRPQLYAGLGAHTDSLEVNAEHDSENVATLERLLAATAQHLETLPFSAPIDRGVAAEWLRQALTPDRLLGRSLALRPGYGTGMFSTPGIVPRLARGGYVKSRFVQLRTVCTAMDESELDASFEYFQRHQLGTLKVTPMSEQSRPPAATLGEPGHSTASTDANDARSSCQCGSHSAPQRQLVYALGRIGYDFASQSRRDSVQQQMTEEARPENPSDLLAHLERRPSVASALHWILSIENIPVYVLEPKGAFAHEAYEVMRRFLREQSTEQVDRLSVPGVIDGVTVLRSGLALPTVSPEIRGMFNWTTDALIAALTSDAEKNTDDVTEKWRQGVQGFLERVYYELRNPGQAPADRALNFAATNALEVANVYASAIRDEMELDSLQVERNPMSPPGADHWDVKLSFFYPAHQVQTVKKVYRITVDVTDVVPVTVGTVRSWFVR